MMKKKTDKKQYWVRVMCIFLAILMAAGSVFSVVFYLLESHVH